MFGIGFGEFAIIFVVLIIAVGPEKLPAFMKTVGKTIRGLRQASRDIRTAVGIDELLREDIDLNRPRAVRKPAAPSGSPVGRQAAGSLPSQASADGSSSAQGAPADASPAATGSELGQPVPRGGGASVPRGASSPAATGASSPAASGAGQPAAAGAAPTPSPSSNTTTPTGDGGGEPKP